MNWDEQNPVSSGLPLLIGLILALLLPLCVLVGGILLIGFLLLKADEVELTAAYAYITELDRDFLQTLRALPTDPSYSDIETWIFVVNGAEVAVEAIEVITDADYLLLYLDQLYGDYQLAAVQAELASWHAALNQYRLDFDPDPDTRRAWVQITTVPAREYFATHPSEFAPMAVSQVETLLAVGPYLAQQFLANPFAAAGTASVITSRFGHRLHPLTGAPDYHTGLDLGMPEGTIVQAVWPGTVTIPAYDADGYGWWLRVSEGERQIIYAHLSTIAVSPGQEVVIGQPLGQVGHSGAATGDHLHLEYRYRGQLLNPGFYLQGISLPATL